MCYSLGESGNRRIGPDCNLFDQLDGNLSGRRFVTVEVLEYFWHKLVDERIIHGSISRVF